MYQYQTKKSFCFFGVTFEQLSIVFWATIEQLFEKLRETFLENLEQLVKS